MVSTDVFDLRHRWFQHITNGCHLSLLLQAEEARMFLPDPKEIRVRDFLHEALRLLLVDGHLWAVANERDIIIHCGPGTPDGTSVSEYLRDEADALKSVISALVNQPEKTK